MKTALDPATPVITYPTPPPVHDSAVAHVSFFSTRVLTNFSAAVIQLLFSFCSPVVDILRLKKIIPNPPLLSTPHSKRRFLEKRKTALRRLKMVLGAGLEP
jgi:hypothetical protein